MGSRGLVGLKMDIVELVREEWSTLGMAVGGLAGAALAVLSREWLLFITSAALVIACLRILQMGGWIPGSE